MRASERGGRVRAKEKLYKYIIEKSIRESIINPTGLALLSVVSRVTRRARHREAGPTEASPVKALLCIYKLKKCLDGLPQLEHELKSPRAPFLSCTVAGRGRCRVPHGWRFSTHTHRRLCLVNLYVQSQSPPPLCNVTIFWGHVTWLYINCGHFGFESRIRLCTLQMFTSTGYTLLRRER